MRPTRIRDKKMKKIYLSVVVVMIAILCNSCVSLNIIPQATNSAGAVAFGELNLNRSEYLVYNTITETATIIFDAGLNKNKIYEANKEFSYEVSYDKAGKLIISDIEGVVKLGTFYHTASNEFDPTNAGEIARKLAIFRLNNSAKEAGADYIIEPIVSVNISKTGKSEITYTATATAKLVRIKKTDD